MQSMPVKSTSFTKDISYIVFQLNIQSQMPLLFSMELDFYRICIQKNTNRNIITSLSRLIFKFLTYASLNTFPSFNN